MLHLFVVQVVGVVEMTRMQVHADFEGQAKSDQCQSDPQALQRHQQDWIRDSQMFLQEDAAASTNAASTKRKLYRQKKTTAWLRCADNALRSGGGFGLQEMVITEGMANADPLQWPYLVVCAVQGSAGVAAFNWLAQTQRFYWGAHR